MKRLFITLVVVLATLISVQAKVLRGMVSSSEGELTFVVDSVDCRKNLTRVYGHLNGRPHTSMRIDAVTMTPASGVLKECTDIDGVDFNRWFQWEDDGVIYLELDFGSIKDGRSGQLTFNTPRGNSLVKWHMPEKNSSNRR